MPADLNPALPNPYTSPLSDPAIVRAELVEASPKPGSIVLFLLGFALLIVGYFTSNFFAIADLYQVGFGPDGKVVPSPFAGAFDTPALTWLFYCVCAAATVAGCILIGSQRFNPLLAVAFLMCPLVGLVFLVGAPLRAARKHALLVAALYLMVGTCVGGVGLIRMIGLYGEVSPGMEPLLASLLTQIGAALSGGAVLKLVRLPPQ